MIFLTVGHQMPFDRLVQSVDKWASSHTDEVTFGQIGNTLYRPQYIESTPHLSPEQFRNRLKEADAVVAHAGTGTILAALEENKPLLVLPRLARFGETRNDHQLSTAKFFSENGYIRAATTEDEVSLLMNELKYFRPSKSIQKQASQELLETVRRFVYQGYNLHT